MSCRQRKNLGQISASRRISRTRSRALLMPSREPRFLFLSSRSSTRRIFLKIPRCIISCRVSFSQNFNVWPIFIQLENILFYFNPKNRSDSLEFGIASSNSKFSIFSRIHLHFLNIFAHDFPVSFLPVKLLADVLVSLQILENFSKILLIHLNAPKFSIFLYRMDKKNEKFVFHALIVIEEFFFDPPDSFGLLHLFPNAQEIIFFLKNWIRIKMRLNPCLSRMQKKKIDWTTNSRENNVGSVFFFYFCGESRKFPPTRPSRFFLPSRSFFSFFWWPSHRVSDAQSHCFLVHDLLSRLHDEEQEKFWKPIHNPRGGYVFSEFSLVGAIRNSEKLPTESFIFSRKYIFI